jgi:hypothetical protein
MTMIVWYKLDDDDPSQVNVEDGANVDHLKTAIKTVFGPHLPCAAPGLKVYAPGTKIPVPDSTDHLKPGTKVSDLSTTDEKPLIVIAPKPQEQQYGK